MARRLFTVIALAAAMGLIFGGLQVASAVSQAKQYSRVTKLAKLGQQAVILASALEEERAETAMDLSAHNNIALAPEPTAILDKDLRNWYGPPAANGTTVITEGITGRAVAGFEAAAAGIGSDYPPSIQRRLAAVQAGVIDDLSTLRGASATATSAPDGGQLDAITNYSDAISTLFQLNDAIAQGAGDPTLTNEVLALGALSRAKDQVSQQRAIMWALLTSYAGNKATYLDATGNLTSAAGQDIPPTAEAMSTSQALQVEYMNSYQASATAAEAQDFQTTAFTQPNVVMQLVEGYVTEAQTPDISSLGNMGNMQGIGREYPDLRRLPATAQWNVISAAAVSQFGIVETQLAQSIVDRGEALQRGAVETAWRTALLTTVVLLLVLLAALLVARSLVLPLRRLRAGALEVASVSLPDRVKELSEAGETPASLDVAPINVLSTDEIGQVARAFDLVHQEAVRLASDEAVLRGSLNAMFVSLSRRSQTLIERLSRMIDILEQNEGDPDRLSSLFAMDHLVTRMRRNSENLLVLGGHEGARKRTDSVLLGDVVRAAASEIEQYGRVVLNVQSGIEVSGQAATDVVHLLAEIIENATLYSPRSTDVHVTGQELSTGGVLIEVADSGVGISEARLEDLNRRLEHPPVINVSVSRHMGLFAVSHLAARHRVAVRLRPASPRGTVAMVWLPDTVAARAAIGYGERLRRLGAGRPIPPTQGAAGFTPLRDSGPIWDSDPQYAPGIPARAPSEYTTPPRGAPGDQREPAGQRPMAGQGRMTSTWFRPKPHSGHQVQGSGGQPRVPTDMPGQWRSQYRQEDQGQGLGASQPRSADQGWAAGPHRGAGPPGRATPEPVSGGTTGAGLPLRVPRANRAPSAPASGMAQPGVPSSTGPLPTLSPESARSRLGGLQRGTRRAEAQAPHAGEETRR